MLNTLSSRDLISLPVPPSNVPIIIPGANVIVSVLLTSRNRTFRVGCFLKASIFDLYNILSVHGRRTLLIVATFTIYSARTLDYHCSLR